MMSARASVDAVGSSPPWTTPQCSTASVAWRPSARDETRRPRRPQAAGRAGAADARPGRRRQPLDRIVDRIWGDTPPARAEVSVRGYVSNLRKALATAGIVADPVINFHGPRLRPARSAGRLRPPTVRRPRRRRHRAPAPQRSTRGARRLLDRTLELHAGPALGTTGEELGLDEVPPTTTSAVATRWKRCVDVRLALGEHAQLPAVLASEIARQPYHERLRAQLALALYRAGRSVEALRAIPTPGACCVTTSASNRDPSCASSRRRSSPTTPPPWRGSRQHDDAPTRGRATRCRRRSPLWSRRRGGAGPDLARPVCRHAVGCW